jgi:hypothetical protein
LGFGAGQGVSLPDLNLLTSKKEVTICQRVAVSQRLTEQFFFGNNNVNSSLVSLALPPYVGRVEVFLHRNFRLLKQIVDFKIKIALHQSHRVLACGNFKEKTDG